MEPSQTTPTQPLHSALPRPLMLMNLACSRLLSAMGLKEYFLNPKKRQVYVEALIKSVPAAPAPAPATPALK